MNVCPTYHGDLTKNCQDISLENKHFNLMVALEEKSEDHQSRRIHPLGTMNMCTKYHDNPSNSCWDISVWIKVVDWMTDGWCKNVLRHRGLISKTVML